MTGEATQSNDLEARIASFNPNDPAALADLEKAVLGTEEVVVDPAKAEVPAKDTPAADAVAKDEQAKKDDKTGAEPAPAAAAAELPDADEGAASGAGKPKGVQAKDGDHIIPYSVLERERDRAARAEATAKALSEQIDAIKAGGPAPAAGQNAIQLSEDDLAQLETDLPGVAKVIRAQMQALEQLTGTVQRLQQEAEIAQNTRAAAAQDDVESAILANPDLLDWRNKAQSKDNPDPKMWNRAADLDAVLREDPEWKDKPVAQRFAKVVETAKSLFGTPSPIPQPGIAAAADQTTEKPATDLKKAADAKLAAAPAPVPTTLSDIPGGAAPAQSDLENLENVSAVQLGQKFLTMSLEQIESYLSRVAQ